MKKAETLASAFGLDFLFFQAIVFPGDVTKVFGLWSCNKEVYPTGNWVIV